MNPDYGKITVEQGYRKGQLSSTVKIVERSIAVHSKQELITNVLQLLDSLRSVNSIGFEVHADARTHEPVRIVVVSKEIV